MDLFNNVMIYHPKTFKVFLITLGILLVFVLMSILHFLGQKRKGIKAEKLMKEVKKREKYIQEKKERLNKKEKEFEQKIISKYETEKRHIKGRMTRKLKKELDIIAGLPTETLIKRYGEMMKNNDIDSLWDV